MKIEIWSDIVCPWCYIGKRRFEKALAGFEGTHDIEIEYKSFQLSPDVETDQHMTTISYLSEKYNVSEQEALAMTQNVTAVAREEGLEYHLENALATNTLRAHELLHFAKAKNKQAQVKEALLKAYFTDNRNVDDETVLLEIAAENELDTEEFKKDLSSGKWKEAVNFDLYEARQIGVRGVPFFVIDRKFGISGAQPAEVFLDALKKASETPDLQ